MKVIKNNNSKTVCHADPATRTVEIVHKGCKTIIQFLSNGKMRVINTTK